MNNNNSFYDWYQPTRSRYPSTFPVEMFQPKATTYTKPSPKIVSIPVHFVQSESTRSESTLQIQKLFRGFMARRRVKQISDLKRQVDEVESRISNSETVEILRIDAKERLRLNETLMSLLLKLDSIHGTVPGVRDCRKALIKKAIALQEKIDDIVTVTDDQTLERKHSISIEEETVRDDSEDKPLIKKAIALQEKIDGVATVTDDQTIERKHSISIEEETVRDESIGEMKSSEEKEEEDASEGDCKKANNKEEEAEMKKCGRRMVMAKLLESNEIQMRMIRSLTERVEQLERALLCEKMKIKKKKKQKKMRNSIVGRGERWELRNYC